MAKEISQEMFDILTSTIWQDFKGYKRDLHLHKSGAVIYYTSICLILQIGCACGTLALWDEGDVFLFFSVFPIVIFGACGWYMYHIFKPLYHMAKVSKVAYDIELADPIAKMIRTKKQKYGIVVEDDDNPTSCRYLYLILSPKYDMIQRTDIDSFIIAKKRSFSSKCFYGIYNSRLRKITVPIRYDKITRPNNNANLYVAELNGQKEKFNSMGDRILL